MNRQYFTWVVDDKILYNGILPSKRDIIVGTLRVWTRRSFPNDGLDGSPVTDRITTDIRYVAMGIVRSMGGQISDLSEKQLQAVWLLAYHKLNSSYSHGKQGASLGVCYNLTRGHWSARLHCKFRYLFAIEGLQGGIVAIGLYRQKYDRYGMANGHDRMSLTGFDDNGSVVRRYTF